MTPVSRTSRLNTFLDSYTKDLTAEDLQRLFTRDTRDAYKFFTRGLDADALARLPWHRRLVAEARMLFMAFSMKLSPARRVVFGGALLLAVVGLVNLFRGFGIIEVGRLPFLSIGVPGDIQEAMLPSGVYSASGVETVGISRPANTVGGDFYDILPLHDGRLVVAVGDVAGKGSPAALLMALLLAMMRTLVDEQLEPADLVARLNVQVCRHAPRSRFITLFYGVYEAASGALTYVSAGHMPPLLLRADGSCERLTDGGIALGMFERSTYTTGRAMLQNGDLVAVYSDGITEAENPGGRPFDEVGLEAALRLHAYDALTAIGAGVVAAVERHTDEKRFADDLTVLLLRRTTPAAAGV
ncbi:MAG: hypothetical protein DMF93_12850 [Acidobacteria bacterium]|nr:MAG: hypothetical protein DMF93_12850 [Acidobacteriota bacterium]